MDTSKGKSWVLPESEKSAMGTTVSVGRKKGGRLFWWVAMLVIRFQRWKKRASARLLMVENRAPGPRPEKLKEKEPLEASSSTVPLLPNLLPLDLFSYEMEEVYSDCELGGSTIDSPSEALVDCDAQLYCALFPPDHEFEESTLVQFWMALGFFTYEPREKYASMFFEDSCVRGCIKFTRFNLLTGKAMYKYIEESSCASFSRSRHIVRIEDSSSLTAVPSEEVSHLSITCRSSFKDSSGFRDFQRFNQLKALIFLQGHDSGLKQVPRDLFLWLRQLQVLDLSKTHLMELPSSIGNVKCLCFLDLSDTPIKRLPDAIDCLENLQTLKLRGCSNLFTLPEGMRKLVNLRHLDFDVFRQLDSMPEGLGDLTNIRTLSAFLVGVETGCSIRQLGNLNNISGSFCISRLENVLTKVEAEEARLSNKSHIKILELHWSDSQDWEDDDDDVDAVLVSTQVLSSLKPNTSLEELYISCYRGLHIPNWTSNRNFSLLIRITLEKCEYCEVLPSLGELPSLKCLTLLDLSKVKVIDDKFCRNSGIPGFLLLEKLTIENMSSLEEWSEIKSFPRLLHFTVKHCPKLRNLATMDTGCTRLEISHCPMLTCHDRQLPLSVETFIIEDCPLFSARFADANEYSQILPHTKHFWIDHKEIISEEECLRALPQQGKPSNSRQYVLHFQGKLPRKLLTKNKVYAEVSAPVKVLLSHAVSGQLIKEGPLSSKRVEIMVLHGHFKAERLEEWTKGEFCRNIAVGRDNKGPLLGGENVISLHNGIGFIDYVYFTDNSSRERSNMFRLGARVVAEEDQVREAVSTPFQVKDRHEKTYWKHDIPSPEDEVCYLHGISKEGKIHKRLKKHHIHKVKDLVRHYYDDPSFLRHILNVTLKKWNEIIQQATSCTNQNADSIKLHISTDQQEVQASQSQMHVDAGEHIPQLEQSMALDKSSMDE